MKNVHLLTGFAFLIAGSQGVAQDLVIAHARIIDGTGQTIERGSILVTDGRISSVSADIADAGVAPVIDARGMAVLPGLIDVHRKDVLGSLRSFADLASDAEVAEAIDEKAPASMRALLAKGFTTVMMPGSVRLMASGELRTHIGIEPTVKGVTLSVRARAAPLFPAINHSH